MANVKEKDLSFVTTLDSADAIRVVNAYATTGESRNIDYDNLLTQLEADLNIVSTKGIVQFLTAVPPTTTPALRNALTGASSPAEQFTYWEFPSAGAYMDFYCRLTQYNGGGLTFKGLLMRTSGSAGQTYIMEIALRRINAATEDLGASHTYAYNAVTVTIPAGPPNAGIPMEYTITFTDGADMDSVADGEFFYLRLRRNGGTATDIARVFPISGLET